MKTEVYNRILHIIRTDKGSNIYPNRECDGQLKEEFPDIHHYTLGSIYSLEYMRKMKRNHLRISKLAHELYMRYCKAIKASESRGILLRMSDHMDLSPALLARIILEQHFDNQSANEQTPVTKSAITKMMKNTLLIHNAELAYEVYLCILHDDQYGPIADCIKHSLGQEFEVRLTHCAQNAGLVFRDEGQLRIRGFDKTPDIKLDVPIAVDGFVVNWIESKALFGDEEAHKTYLKDQYLCYWNRFGPGLVIYWFGFLDSLHQHSDNKIIIHSDFPAGITCFDPTSVTK